MKIGYARVSSADQNLDRQLEALKVAGAEKLFSEKVSGKSTDGRKALQECLAYIREGDTLIILSFDRLARSLHDLLDIVQTLHKKGAQIKSLNENIDTTTSEGQYQLALFGAFAQFERAVINQRQKEGIALALAKGKKFGRPALKVPKNFNAIVARWQKKEITGVEACKLLNLTKPSFYRLLKDKGIETKKTS